MGREEDPAGRGGRAAFLLDRRNIVDVVVIGAGAVGAACAYFAARAGLTVHVVERDGIASGTTSAGEGNVLVSDKEAGPELDLALYSHAVWGELAEFGPLWELEEKGGLVVASTEAGAAALEALAVRQRDAGIDVVDVDPEELPTYEPHISRDLRAGAFYPQDAQVQPMLLAAELLRLARDLGATVTTDCPVLGVTRTGSRITGVRTSRGEIAAGAVINAAGTWAGAIAELAGVHLPVLPRRGFVLVTEPLPVTIRHKVYAGEYVANVLSSDEALQTSPVIEGTPSGTVLIGSSRERVGFDRTVSLPVLRELARGAIRLFPVLAEVRALRSYLGFRPYCPDHLPIVGADPRAPGLWHAAGHEGAGIGLSVGTAKLLVQAIRGEPTDLDLRPFRPDRFDGAPA
jgi:glycine/D-amino acid oxidase-like deaminating enzyme